MHAMANPVLTPKAFSKSGLGRADNVMTIQGTANAIAVLFGLTAVSAFAGWKLVVSSTSFPAIIMPASIISLLLALGVCFKQEWAMPLGICYAVFKGLTVGAIAHFYDFAYPGLPLMALFATFTVFSVMWGLWRGGVIKVTQRFRSTVMAATLAVFLLYIGSMVINFFTPVTFLQSSSALSIGLSVLITGIAAFNLCLDFDLIDKGIEHRAPAHMQWYAAFGLLVTVVWLYIEILRLLAKIQRR